MIICCAGGFCVQDNYAEGSGAFLKQYKVLNIKGAILDRQQLNSYLEKIAITHNVKNKSNKNTYPVPRMIDNFKVITEVYNLLNEHIKLGINIHPAGEWLLDNFYAIEETVKGIKKELTIKKYKEFVGIKNGPYAGFARIYVLANEIIAYTDNKIESEDLEEFLRAYQTKKNLSMDEIWNIGIFLQIGIIENIREICEKIYSSQIKKYKVENIIERLVENKPKAEQVFKIENINSKINEFKDLEYSFIEYMSYALKRYGKKAYGYLNILEEEVQKVGLTVSEVIKKEHFDIAVRKVSIGNCITSIKTIQRINFLDIFQRINSVEEILKQDPANVYEKMDYKTKEYYRNKIKEISNKTKISEIYISRKILELASNKELNSKQSHIGYYLIDKGINKLYDSLNYQKTKQISNKNKTKIYITIAVFLTALISAILPISIYKYSPIIYFLSSIILLLPISELVLQIIQYILGKVIKPKMLPKIDFLDGIDEENSTFVVIPTIIKTREKVAELARKLEVYYLSNKSDNLYFAILGDCSQSKEKEESFDKDVIDEGLKQVQRLNQKYGKDIFNFLYRERVWNEKENSFLGWERKRGLLNQFNEYLINKQSGKNEKFHFIANTLEEKESLNIKYVITLDADTDLILNSAFELVGTMAHILNKPIIDEEKNIVIEGFGIIQPRVGINLDISYKNVFTKIFAGSGGIDSYTNAISDIYQDNFEEGIFTGKGIYDLKVFSKVLKNAIPENTVLSHDLLEGCYLRCGLATDILLMDGYPVKYTSFMTRLARWIRGDWQIKTWLSSYIKSNINDCINNKDGVNSNNNNNRTNNKLAKSKNPLNLLSKYKIFDNLRRSLLEISIVFSIIYFEFLKQYKGLSVNKELAVLYIIAVFPFILELINHITGKRDREKKQKTFTPKIDGIKGSIYRGIITFSCLPYKAYVSICAIIKTMYRMRISHKNLLEWQTSEEAEKTSKTDLFSYYKIMFFNVIIGALFVIFGLSYSKIIEPIIGILWILSPFIMCTISKEYKEKAKIEELKENEKQYVLEIGKRTWEFFKTYLNEKNNYLMPDNYQENRIPLIVNRTSSTNIGLSILAVISSYDLGYSNLDETIDLLEKIIRVVDELPKWNGHLYNWYKTTTKEPLIPRYISTVDSGNFIGYMYVTKQFLIDYKDEIKEKEEVVKQLIEITDKIIENTDFAPLYNKEHRLFSIGFNIEENKLTDSYYDLLASEARQASLVAIAKKNVPSKHWNSLSRTMTVLNKYKGLVSWSGTAFEYLMPNINIPKIKGSLLDESSNFLIMSQIEYAKELGLPWGISESAFNLKDLHSNYQYKAFGIPWLGLKRGLADELVVSSYGSILAIADKPKEVIANLKELEKKDMLNKYGFYESIDYTPARLKKGERSSPVKTYMAHHQGLILLSINNLFNNNILQKRFVQNPEIEAVSILLQERMPETFITTKENKEKVEKIKYKDYENYIETVYEKVDGRILRGNVISNEDYTIAIDQKGRGFSKYKDIYINRYKKTDDYPQGIFFYIKNIRNKKIWSSNYNKFTNEPDKYSVNFMPDKTKIERIDENVKTKISTIVSPTEPVEIRKLELENLGNTEEILEITSYLEPVLSKKEQDYAHPAFNNLFLTFEYDEQTKSIKVKRKKRNKGEREVSLFVGLSTNCEVIGDTEYEIEKDRFIRKRKSRNTSNDKTIHSFI